MHLITLHSLIFRSLHIKLNIIQPPEHKAQTFTTRSPFLGYEMKQKEPHEISETNSASSDMHNESESNYCIILNRFEDSPTLRP